MFGAIVWHPERQRLSVCEIQFWLLGCKNRLQHRCKPAITNRVKDFTPKGETVNLALSLVSWKVETKILYTHVASQVFIRSHNRHFSPAVNEKPFNIVITWGEFLSHCHPLGILPLSFHRLEGWESCPRGLYHTNSMFSIASCHIFHVWGSPAEKGVIQVCNLQGARRLTSDEVRLSGCDIN